MMDGADAGDVVVFTPTRSQQTGALPWMNSTQRSLFGDSAARLSSGSAMSNKSSRARLFAQRDGRVKEDFLDSARESCWDSSLHKIRPQQPWSSTARGTQVPWRTHTSYDRLNFELEAHPSCVAKAPGTFSSTFERELTYPPPRSARHVAPLRSARRRPFAGPPAWDARFLVANSLSDDPVVNGHRKGLSNRRGTTCGNLTPTRRFNER